MYFHDVRLGLKYHSHYFWLNVPSTAASGSRVLSHILRSVGRCEVLDCNINHRSVFLREKSMGIDFIRATNITNNSLQYFTGC